MKIHQFEHSEVLPVSLEEAWTFFSEPKNLDDLTPPDLKFQTLSGNDEPMFAGQIIVHRIRLAPLVWTTWVTEITTIEPLSYFIDEQRSGPYRFWHHLHRFEETEDGNVKMTDRVHYAVPFGPLGSLAHPIFVRPKLEKIFAYRKERTAEIFG